MQIRLILTWIRKTSSGYVIVVAGFVERTTTGFCIQFTVASLHNRVSSTRLGELDPEQPDDTLRTCSFRTHDRPTFIYHSRHIPKTHTLQSCRFLARCWLLTKACNGSKAKPRIRSVVVILQPRLDRRASSKNVPDSKDPMHHPV